MAFFYLKRMLRIAHDINSKNYVAEANLLMSKNYANNLHLKDSALFYINLALQNVRRTSDKSLLADCFHQQALPY